jgi:heptosyltransferase-2
MSERGEGRGSPDPCRILVLGPNKPFLGAQIVQIPFLSELRSRYPQSRITLALPFSETSLFEEFRFHDELLRGYAESGAQTLRFFARCVLQRYDRVYSLRARSARSGVAAWLTGARRRYGFAANGSRLFFNRRVSPREDVYLALKYLDLLGDEEPPSEVPSVPLWTPEIALGVTALFVERGIRSPCVGIIVGAGGKKKRWPAANFAVLADKIREEFPGVQPLFFLSPDEASSGIGEELAEIDPREKFCLQDLRVLACALSRCATLISSDCGPAHFGHLIGVEQVTLFEGTGRPYEWFLPRAGASYLLATGDRPVASIGVADVMEVARQIVAFSLR